MAAKAEALRLDADEVEQRVKALETAIRECCEVIPAGSGAIGDVKEAGARGQCMLL